MTKIRVTKSFGFETGHALYGYDGLCKNVHGHSYKLYVTVIGSPIDDQNHVKNGMVIDFKDLKTIVKSQGARANCPERPMNSEDSERSSDASARRTKKRRSGTASPRLPGRARAPLRRPPRPRRHDDGGDGHH